MWPKWIHSRAGKERRAEKPLCWWQQLETNPRIQLPFGHLFPRLPTSRQQRSSESRELVKQLVRDAKTRPTLEDHVQAHLQVRTPQTSQQVDQVEPWQIVSIARLDEAEARKWGAGGQDVVEWFDKGELVSWAVDEDETMEASRSTFQRLMDWLRGRPAPRLVSAEI